MTDKPGDTQQATAPDDKGAKETSEQSEVIDLDAQTPETGEGEEGEAKTGETTEAKAETTAEDTASSDDGEDEDTPPKRLKGAAKWRARARELEAEVARLKVADATAEPEPAKPTPKREASQDIEAEVEKRIGKKPQESDFKDWLEYDRALRVWDTEAVIERREIKREAVQRNEQTKANWREVWDDHQERVEAVTKVIPDYDDVLTSSKVEISPQVAEIALSSDKSELILYHLAKNPDRARALNAMSQIGVAKEIGRLEDRLHLPKPKTETKATTPETRLAGGAAPESQDAALASWLKKTYG